MKKIAALALGMASLGPVAAQAGGLAQPVTEPVVAAPIVEVAPSTDWTGAYGGLSLGYGDLDASGAPLDGSGAIGGVLGGYRWDFGQWVAGVEADYDFADIDLGDNLGSLDSVARLKLQGGADLGQAFLYGTAGYAYATAEVAGSDLSDDGWFGGVGLDYAVTDRWLVGGEVLMHQFDDFDSSGVDIDATTFKVRAAYRF